MMEKSLLREHKGYKFYDGGYVNDGTLLDKKLLIEDSTNEIVNEFHFSANDPKAVNKAIELAKEWVNKEIKKQPERADQKSLEDTDEEFEARLDREAEKIGEYSYNENGVCLNETIVISNTKKGCISYEIGVARCRSGWTYSYQYSCESSLTGTGLGSHGAGIDDKGFITMAEATLKAIDEVLEAFQRYFKNVKQLRKQSARLNPLRELKESITLDSDKKFGPFVVDQARESIYAKLIEYQVADLSDAEICRALENTALATKLIAITKQMRDDEGLTLEQVMNHNFGPFDPEPVRKCRVCGCTEDNCQQCVEKTGSPCHWVEQDLCSACVDEPKVEVKDTRAIANQSINLNENDMNFFQQLASMGKVNLSFRIFQADDKLIVELESGSFKDKSIKPVRLTGTPEEIDNGFFDNIIPKVQEIIGLVHNLEEVKSEVDKKLTEPAAKKEPAKKATPSSVSPKKKTSKKPDKAIKKKEDVAVEEETEPSLFDEQAEEPQETVEP